MSNPHAITSTFEAALCAYTGAKYAVTTTSCTIALEMALAWEAHSWTETTISIPKRTYVGVPAAILNAGHRVKFHDENWIGEYLLNGSLVWDCARRFTSGMYRPGFMQCVSFHASKILGDSQGGAILHDCDEADAWLRRARFDGRTEGVDPEFDQVTYPSFHAYLSPDVAARLLWKLSVLPRHNEPLPNSRYPDLSLMEAFKP